MQHCSSTDIFLDRPLPRVLAACLRRCTEFASTHFTKVIKQKVYKRRDTKNRIGKLFLPSNWACRPGIDSSWDCLQMAARETGIGAVETFMHAGKLLALDLLVKVLENQSHTWSHVRQEVRPIGQKHKISYCSTLTLTNFAFCILFFCCVLLYGLFLYQKFLVL